MQDVLSRQELVNDRSAKSEEPNKSSKRIASVFIQSFSSLFKTHKNLYQLFFSIIKKLNKFFSLSKAVLIVHSVKDNKLKVIAMKGKKQSGQGLAITLPAKESLFYGIFERRETYTQNYPDDFEGNFIEKKLLIDEETSSIAICPIKYNGSIQGLLCLTSPTHYAFSMFEDGLLDGVLEYFGKSIHLELKRLHL